MVRASFVCGMLFLGLALAGCQNAGSAIEPPESLPDRVTELETENSQQTQEIRQLSFELAQATGNYVVMRGDSIAFISKKFGLTVAELRRLNSSIQDPNDRLEVGDVLRIKP